MAGIFNPDPHFIKVRGGLYLPVAARIAWFRQDHPDWSIITEIIETSENFSICRGTIKDETNRVIATAVKSEDRKGFADHLEKAETGSVGRALALCGYGTLHAMDLNESNPDKKEHHVVDSEQKDLRPQSFVEKVLETIAKKGIDDLNRDNAVAVINMILGRDVRSLVAVPPEEKANIISVIDKTPEKSLNELIDTAVEMWDESGDSDSNK